MTTFQQVFLFILGILVGALACLVLIAVLLSIGQTDWHTSVDLGVVTLVLGWLHVKLTEYP